MKTRADTINNSPKQTISRMETIFFQGNACHTCGTVPTLGETAPCYNLAGPDLSQVLCSDFAGKRVVLNVFPSLDTPVCATSVRRFNQEAVRHPDVVVINVSMDLPFAMGRFCAAEGIKDVLVASAFRSPLFGQKYGLQIVDGPLAGLLARCVLVLDENRRVIFRDLVEEITHEPDYEAALKVLKKEGMK